MSSNSQRTANRANSQLSTGPKSPEGKAKSSLNAGDEAAVLSEPKIQAMRGLTGRTVLLPSDDAVAYQQHIQRFFDEYKPEGPAEHALTQSVADTEWRLLRIPSLEIGIYALGRLEFAAKFESEDPAVRASLIEAQVFLAYQKQLDNLSIQEERLRKQREKDRAELLKLQQDRKQWQERRMKQAVDLYQDVRRAHPRFDPAKFSFEFSTEEIEQHLADVDKRFIIRNRTFFIN